MAQDVLRQLGNMNSVIRIAIVAILLLAGVFAGFVFCFPAQLFSAISPSEVAEPGQWPAPLQSLCKSSPAIQDSVRVFRFDAFINEKSIWLIDGNDETISRFIDEQSLESVTANHPKVKSLLKLIPDDWPSPNLATSEMHATKGYGTEHQEGVDLMLVIRDAESDVTIVLHEWIF